MATTKDMDAFIAAVMECKNLDHRMACAWALGYVTEYVPTEKLENAINYMKDNR